MTPLLQRLLVPSCAFVLALLVSPAVRTATHASATAPGSPAELTLACPRPAYAAGSCSLAAVVCANDSSPGCETICFGEQTPTCEQGSCSVGGNIVSMNRCYCKP